MGTTRITFRPKGATVAMAKAVYARYAGAAIGIAPLLAAFRRDGAAVLFESARNGALASYDSRLEYFLFLGFVIAGACVWARLCARSTNPYLSPGNPVVLAAASLLATAAAEICVVLGGPAAVGLAGTGFMGLAVAVWIAVVTPAWGAALSSFNRHAAMGVIAFGLLVSLVPSTVGAFVDGTFKPLVAVLPLVSGALLVTLFRGDLTTAPEPVPLSLRTPDGSVTFAIQRYPLFLAALVLLGGVIRGFLNNGSFINAHNPANNLTTHVVAVTLVLSVLFVATRYDKTSLGLRRAWGLLFAFLLGSLLLIAFLSVEIAPLVPLGRSLVIAGNTCLTVLFWTMLVCMQPRGGVARFEAYAVVEALAALCSYLLTPAFAQYLGISLENQVFGCSLATAFVLAIATFAFLGNGGPREEKPRLGTLEICQALAPVYGLTEREVQICALLAQGHTLEAIASQLGLSANTVRSYSKDLYRKLGVHKKQEIVELIAQQREG